jgi:DnaK suppressor protein
MNATVTKSAKKSISAKNTPKTMVKATAPAKAKPAIKSRLKVAAKPAKTVKGTLKPAAKTTKTSTKSVAKPATATARKGVAAAAKPALKPAAKPAVKSATVKKAAPAAVKAATAKTGSAGDKVKTGVKQASKSVAVPGPKISAPPVQKAATAAIKVDSAAAKLDAHMSANNVAAIFVDKIQKSVVSKVSEVATKTTKPTPAVPADGTLLTEAQILKMSDKDYMNAAQLAFFKARLQQLEKDLLKNAGETTEHLRETVLVPDPADRATIEEEHALELRTRDRERKLLKKVQQSIASIDAGDYGWCEETGEPIGIPRLLARPTATLSLEAQQRRELKQKLYGD